MKKNFRTYFKDFKPCVASHRGYGKYGEIAENTVSAFLASEKLGFKAHELDVRRTIDGSIVLLHGPRLENTTDGTGRVERTRLEKIRGLDAAYYVRQKYPERKPQKARVPTLAEVLNATKKRTIVNVEIKRDRWDLSRGLEEAVVDTVRSCAAQGRVCFSGFHFLTLWRLKRLNTGIPVGLLIEPGIFARAKLWIYKALLRPDNVHLHYSTATESLVKKLRAKGYGLAFWTVNNANIARALFSWGADLVITDNMEFVRIFK